VPMPNCRCLQEDPIEARFVGEGSCLDRPRCRPCAHEHNQIDWLLPEDVLSLRLADSVIAVGSPEAQGSGDAPPGRRPTE
jgi:hypothetical protein